MLQEFQKCLFPDQIRHPFYGGYLCLLSIGNIYRRKHHIPDYSKHRVTVVSSNIPSVFANVVVIHTETFYLL